MLGDLVDIVVLVAVVLAVGVGARRVRLPEPILLVLTGVVLSYLPGLPSYRLRPDIVLVLFLPPLLYAAAVKTSVQAFRAALRPIGLLSVGLTLFTTGLVGVVAHAAVPGLSLAAAFALGAIVAPPDAVAATAVARRAGLPSRIVTVLEGESLFNDATALVAYRVAVAAVVGGTFSALGSAAEFVWASAGGLAIGAAVALVLAQVRRRTTDPLVDTALSLLAPFAAYLPAEGAHASGVLAVVVTGLYLGNRAPVLQSARSRIISESVWKVIDFLLQGVVFTLIGLQLPGIVERLGDYRAGTAAVAAAVVVAAVVVGRFVWVFPATYLPRLLPRIRASEPRPPWQLPAVVSWAGMRGVVSLAAAFALPLSTHAGTAFPQRNLLLLLTFVVIATTLVLQGLTLPLLIRRLRLPAPDPVQDLLAEAAAQHSAATAALQRLDVLLAQGGAPAGVEQRLRELAENRRLAAWERLGGGGGGTLHPETPSTAYRRLRREMLSAERAVFVQLRDEGRLGDEVLRRVQRELDLEESTLLRD